MPDPKPDPKPTNPPKAPPVKPSWPPGMLRKESSDKKQSLLQKLAEELRKKHK